MITTLNPCNFDHLKANDPQRLFQAAGLIPLWVLDWRTHRQRTLREHIDAVYAHGGGWRHQEDWVASFSWNATTFALKYPEDPALFPFMKLEQNEVEFYLYDMAIVVIVAKGTGDVITIQRWD